MNSKRALGLFLMVAGACAYGAGCGSSGGGGGTGGVTGTGGHGGATGGAPGTGGHGGATGGAPGTGGAAGTGGATVDAGSDVRPDVAPDAPADAPADAPRDVAAIDAPTDRTPTDVAPTDAGDAGTHATFTQVYAILSNVTTPSTTTSPGCKNCHSGIGVDGGAPTNLPQSMDFSTRLNAYNALVNVDSIRCGTAADGSVDLKRVVPFSPDTSAMISKLRAGLGIGTVCGGGPMPRNNPGADGGPSLTMYAITMADLNLIIDWVNGGALNN
jgi:hypothetical protein